MKLPKQLLFCAGLFLFGNQSGAAPPQWRFERMRPADMAEAIRTRAIAWVPLGPLEWHGEALAFGTDPLVGTALAEAAWSKAGGVLLPTLYIGSETHFRDMIPGGYVDKWGLEKLTGEQNPGSVYARNETLELYMNDTLYGLLRNGFRLAVIVSGHGGLEHIDVLRKLEDRWRNMPMKVVVWRDAEPPAGLRFEGSGGHADFAEASAAAAVDPSLLDRRRFGAGRRDQAIGIKPENAAKIDIEKARRAFEWEVDQMAKRVGAAYDSMPKAEPYNPLKPSLTSYLP